MKIVSYCPRCGAPSDGVFPARCPANCGFAVDYFWSPTERWAQRKLEQHSWALRGGTAERYGKDVNASFIPEVMPILGDLLWRQIYPPMDHALFDHHIAVAKENGVKVLQVTFDSPLVGKREYMQRSGWGPGIMHMGTYLQMLGSPHWLFGTLAKYMLHGGLPDMDDWPEASRKWWGGPHTYGATAQDFTWERQVTQYLELYEWMTQR